MLFCFKIIVFPLCCCSHYLYTPKRVDANILVCVNWTSTTGVKLLLFLENISKLVLSNKLKKGLEGLTRNNCMGLRVCKLKTQKGKTQSCYEKQGKITSIYNGSESEERKETCILSYLIGPLRVVNYHR